jgi:serine protease Do
MEASPAILTELEAQVKNIFPTTYPSRHFFAGRQAILLLAILLLTNGCAISRAPKNTQENLVGKEAPVFDKRFQEVSFNDLRLNNFWVTSEEETIRKPVPVHNYTFAQLSDSVKNGVVNIYTLRLEERDAKFGISPNDLLPIRIPIISSIFEIVPFQVPIPFRTQGVSLGSGFIINDRGYILTNAHVVHNAVDIRVVLSEGKEYPGKIIGVDRLTDTALIKIETDFFLNPIPLGNSDGLKTGEMVLAIGNPLGLKHTVTSGLISAKERISPNPQDRHVNFLQTDSAINPGSSGGPLLNLYGEVVGINTAILSDAQLIGFAVPINTVKEVMPMLVLGQTERGWFGVQATPLTMENAVELNFDGEQGLLVTEVEKGSPAEQSDLKTGDIIVAFEGQPIKNFVVFRRKLLGLAPGKKVTMKVSREGKTMEITSTLIKKPAEE